MGVVRMVRVVVAVGMAVAAVAAQSAWAADGEYLFAHRCGFCHTFRTLGHRQIGPDLTEISTRMEAATIRRYIEAPRSVDAQSRMPASRGLRPGELEAVVCFLVGERIAAIDRRR